jgi:phosphoribosylaminoimidazolecarboxamide formyltransferase/IMP cyclohydrolase
MSVRPIQRALLSVSDKTGLVEFAQALRQFNVELISTGGTYQALKAAGLPVAEVAEVTQSPEMLDGRVKTLHPRIHGGILAVRDNPQHLATLQQHGIGLIDLVVCNLYPFEKTLAKPGSSHHDIIENIDVGGPSMLRAAAKNYEAVAVVTDPGQYAEVVAELRQYNGSLTYATRQHLAGAAFARTAAYDQAISAYFAAQAPAPHGEWPPWLTLALQRQQALRYGENPHQQAALYADAAGGRANVVNARVLHGKELSFNNLLDLDSALGLVRRFDGPACVMIKHNNPCGAAVADSLAAAFTAAYAGDPVSAFGGILGCNREVDLATAELLCEDGRFLECIIAPGFADAALHLLTTKPTWKKSVRLLATGLLDAPAAAPARLDFRPIDGGMLVQTLDDSGDDFGKAQVVTKRQPTTAEWEDLKFAWRVAQHVKSNAIVLAKALQVVGVGAGQMSRVDSTHLAVRKAGERVKGSVLASDAFFPFRDNVDEAARAGVAAIVQPGGSKRDADSIAACDEHGLAMVFTGVRHFRH